MTLQQLKEEAMIEYVEDVRYGNEKDFIDSLINKAYNKGKKEGESGIEKPCDDGETKTYKLLNRRAISISVSKFFNSKRIKKTGYFYLFSHCGWLLSNNPLNRKRRKDVKDIDTYLFKDVLLNLNRFFKKEDCGKHLLNLIEIISSSYDKQVDNKINDYLMKNNKFLSQ